MIERDVQVYRLTGHSPGGRHGVGQVLALEEVQGVSKALSGAAGVGVGGKGGPSRPPWERGQVQQVPGAAGAAGEQVRP